MCLKDLSIISYSTLLYSILQIRVRNSLYESEPSTPVTVNTPEGRPGPIQKLRAIPQGPDQFKITWNPPKEPNGELHGYRLYYQEGLFA